MSLWLRITQLFGLSTNTAIHLLSIIVLDGFILYFLVVIRRLNQHNSMVLGAFAFFVLTPFASLTICRPLFRFANDVGFIARAEYFVSVANVFTTSKNWGWNRISCYDSDW